MVVIYNHEQTFVRNNKGREIMRSKDPDLMKKIIDYIDQRYMDENIIPSMQEIADECNTCKSVISEYIKQMVEQGLVEKPQGARTIITPTMRKMHKGQIDVPVVGDIACGGPMLAEQNIVSIMTLPRELTGTGNFYMLYANGDSMIDAGIEDGDIVLVKLTHDVKDGDIVVALVDNENTLKRIYKDKEHNKVILHPENKKYKDIILDEVNIQGVATRVIKQL